MVNFQELRKWGQPFPSRFPSPSLNYNKGKLETLIRNARRWQFENGAILKEREGVYLGDFEIVGILKEEEGDISGDFEIVAILKEREGVYLGDFEIVAILKEREGFNLGDGKFSGIPDFQEMEI